MKPLSELTLLDRFLFACAMEDMATMQLVLQIILGKNVTLMEVSQAEKELRTAPWLRSIRLDVITMDEAGIYNTEVQKKNTGNLSRRSRFYQALIDGSLLMPGEKDFNRMPESTLITIAPFDIFGEGKYCYTFRMKCEESQKLWLGDGATRIFLNTRGTNPDEVSEELVEMLHYFEKSTAETALQCKSDRVKELHQQVSRIKSSEKIGVRYMQEWEERAYWKEEGMEEGLKEGLKALIQTCRELGLSKEETCLKVKEKLPLTEEYIKCYLDDCWANE